MSFHVSQLSFRTKSLLLLGLVQAIMVSGMISLGVDYYKTEMLEHTEAGMSGVASALAASLQDTLHRNDLAQLQVQLENVQRESGLVYVRVRDSHGRIIAAAGSGHDKQGPPVSNKPLDLHWANNIFEHALPIMADGKRLGDIELGMYTYHIKADMQYLFRTNGQ